MTQVVVGDGVPEASVQAQRDALADPPGIDGEIFVVEPDHAVANDGAVAFMRLRGQRRALYGWEPESAEI